MPVILDAQNYGRWLGGDSLAGELQAMLHPYPHEPMIAYPIGQAIGNVKNDRPELVLAI
jgi:putative SOS response-associated peptidase YedK